MKTDGDARPSGFPAVGYLALFGSIIAINAYMYLIRNVSPAVATSYAYVNPGGGRAAGYRFCGRSAVDD